MSAGTFLNFGGGTFSPTLDAERLRSQLVRVLATMQDGQWRTLSEIHSHININYGYHDSGAGISARLRQLRALGCTVVTNRRGDPSRGLFEYQLIMPAGGVTL